MEKSKFLPSANILASLLTEKKSAPQVKGCVTVPRLKRTIVRQMKASANFDRPMTKTKVEGH